MTSRSAHRGKVAQRKSFLYSSTLGNFEMQICALDQQQVLLTEEATVAY